MQPDWDVDKSFKKGISYPAERYKILYGNPIKLIYTDPNQP